MNTWGIDVATVDATKMIKALSDLDNVEHVESMGAYHQITEYTQIHLSTTWDQDQLDNWLYKNTHGCDYVGTFGVN